MGAGMDFVNVTRLCTWLRQAACSHVVSTSTIRITKRDDQGYHTEVSAPCKRCGKVLFAEYGLALNARLVQ